MPENRMTMGNARTQLIDLLADVAYTEGDVGLASGARSDFYLDCKRLSYRPDGAKLIGEVVWEAIRNENVSAVGGLTLGADMIVASTLFAADRGGVELPGFIVRKEPKKHGLQKWIEGHVPDKGSRVAIVDDVVTSGGSVMDAVREATKVGLVIAVVVPLVDRLAGAREMIEGAGLKFRPICTATEVRDAFRNRHSPAYA
jgi:orotate phosphoribosyltransferase